MKTHSVRGYDDTQSLTEMADGIISGKYASVTDAAKSVLNEDGGSNVDRLRRKYRDEKWFEQALRGLHDEIGDKAKETPDTLSLREMVIDFFAVLSIPYRSPVKFLKEVFTMQYLNSAITKVATISAFAGLLPVISIAKNEGINLEWFLLTCCVFLISQIPLGFASRIHRDYSDVEPDFYVKW